MHYNQIPEKPLTVAPSPTVENAVKTYFYDVHGRIIDAQAGEAWVLHKKHKQIGVSDGKHYASLVQEAKRLLLEQGLVKSQELLRQAYLEEIEIARGHLEVPPNPDRYEFVHR